MKNTTFFILGFWFLSPLLVAVFILEFLFYRVPTSYSFKHDQLQEKASQIEVLVLGTSHAFYSYNPAVFQRPGFNLANTSQSLIIDEQLFSKYLTHLSHLKLVVLNLSYFSFEYKLYGAEDESRGYFYPQVYRIWGDGGLWSLFDLRTISRVATLGPDVARRILRSNFHESLARETSAWGWFNSTLSKAERLPISDEAGAGRAKYHTSTLRPQLSERNIKAVMRISELAKSRGAHVILAQAPAARTYFEHLDERAVQRFHQYVEQLRRDQGLIFYDYLKDARFRLEDFFDNDHLNGEAATRWSQMFDQEVLQPNLAPNP